MEVSREEEMERKNRIEVSTHYGPSLRYKKRESCTGKIPNGGLCQNYYIDPVWMRLSLETDSQKRGEQVWDRWESSGRAVVLTEWGTCCAVTMSQRSACPLLRVHAGGSFGGG